MLKVQVDHVRMHVVARFRAQGSVLAESIMSEAVGIETRLELDSPEDPEKVARLVRTAEQGCFIIQTLKKPVAVTSTALLNGEPLAGT